VAEGINAVGGSNFNGTGATGNGLDAMMVKLIGNIWKPMQWLMSIFGYLAGILLIFIGISRLLKSEQEGARGPTGIGTLMTFLVGGCLIAANKMMGAFSNSLFGTDQVKNEGILKYTAGMADAAAHANAVIAAIVAFVSLVGWISFLRGFFIIRGVAEGNSQASMMAGITHLLGGAIAVNLGPIMMAVQTTLGITDYGIEFK